MNSEGIDAVPEDNDDSSVSIETEFSDPTSNLEDQSLLPSHIDAEKKEDSDSGQDEGSTELEEGVDQIVPTEDESISPILEDLPPLPIRGLDIHCTTRLLFDTATYGGRHFFEYTVGEIAKNSSWNVPAGTSQGEEFRFLGKGEEGSFGGENGDLIVSVEVDQSTRAHDITHQITIPWENSLHKHLAKITLNRGPDVEVVRFEIPANIRSGQYIRVRGAGSPMLEDLPAGDLIVQVTVNDPLPPQDVNAYAVVDFWAGVKLFFRLRPKVKIYKISNNQFIKTFNKLQKKHTPEISWTFPGEGEIGKGSHSNSDLYLTPHYTGKAYLAPAISSFVIFLMLTLSILGQQTLTWTGNDAFYAKYLSEPAQSGPSSSTRNENITFETTKPTWAPDGFQLIDSDPNVAVRMPDPATYDCSSAKTLNCLNVEIYTKVKCEVLNASVVFYSENLKVNETANLKLDNFRDLNVTTVKFFPRSKKPFPKWDFLSVKCVQGK